LELVVEVEGRESIVLPGGGADLVAFMSFCVARGFGAQHPLIALAERLEARRVRVGPLTMFYGADAEDSEDREKADLAWQDAAPLVETLEGALALLADDDLAATLLRRAGATGLPGDIDSLCAIARAAEAAGLRLRLLYRD